MGKTGPAKGTKPQPGSRATLLGGPKGPKPNKGVAQPSSGKIPKSVKAALRDILDTPLVDDPEGRSRIDVAWQTVTDAMFTRENGKPTPLAVQAAEGLIDRYYGKARQHVEVEGSGMAVLDLLDKLQAPRVQAALGGAPNGQRSP